MIDENLPIPGEIPEEGVDFHDEFRRKSFAAWAWLKDFAFAMRRVVPQINDTADTINTQRNYVAEALDDARAYANTARSAADQATGVVIPTDAAYDTDAVDEMVARLGNLIWQNTAAIDGAQLNLE